MGKLNSNLTDKEQLLRKKAQIQAEINNYPGPIAGCDQQFNHLLAQRAEIRKALQTLAEQKK